MNKGRYGHASTVFFLKSEENVIVAGGCNGKGEVEESVEMYSLNKNRWTHLQNLPTPRIYFTLQVDSVSQWNNKNSLFSSKKLHFVLSEATPLEIGETRSLHHLE